MNNLNNGASAEKSLKTQYLLIVINERVVTNVDVFPTIEEAQENMRDAVMAPLEDFLENFTEDEDYGFGDTWAWSDYGSECDWTIVKLSVGENLVITAKSIPDASYPHE